MWYDLTFESSQNERYGWDGAERLPSKVRAFLDDRDIVVGDDFGGSMLNVPADHPGGADNGWMVELPNDVAAWALRQEIKKLLPEHDVIILRSEDLEQ